MEKKNIDYMKDKLEKDLIEHIFEKGFGVPIAFTAVPTLAEMDANTFGYYSTSIYIKFDNGTGISIAGVAMT